MSGFLVPTPAGLFACVVSAGVVEDCLEDLGRDAGAGAWWGWREDREAEELYEVLADEIHLEA